MRNNATRRIDRLDRLLLFIAGMSVSAVPAIVERCNLDVRLVLFPTVAYAIWIVFKTIVPSVLLSYPERAIMERVRGWMYLTSMALTFLAFSFGFALFSIRPASLGLTPMIGFLSGLVNYIIVRWVHTRLFRKELVHMNETQINRTDEILRNTLYASCSFSFSILWLNGLLLMETFSFQDVMIGVIGSLLVFVPGVYFERKATNLTHELAVSLLNSRWFDKYSGRT